MSVMQKLKVAKADRKQHPEVSKPKGHLTLYADPRSTCSRKVMLLLALKGINYDLVNIDLPAKGQKLPYFISAYHPFGKVPVLVYNYMDSLDIDIKSDVNQEKNSSFSFSGRNSYNSKSEEEDTAATTTTTTTGSFKKNRGKYHVGKNQKGQKGLMREVVVFESYAIMRYIVDKFAIAERTNYFNNQKHYNDQLDVLYSTSIDTREQFTQKSIVYDGDLEERAKIDSWLSIAANYFKPSQMIIQKEIVLKKRYQTGTEPDMNKVEAALQDLSPMLDTMEKIFPQDSLYLMSNTYLSIADIAFLPELDMLEVSGHLEELLLPRPKLHRWYLAMKEQEDWQRVISIPVLENGGPFPSTFPNMTPSSNPLAADFIQKEKTSLKATRGDNQKDECAQSSKLHSERKEKIENSARLG